MQYIVDSGQFDSSWAPFMAILFKTGVSPFDTTSVISNNTHCTDFSPAFRNLRQPFLLSIYILARRRGTPGHNFLIAASCAMAVLGTMQIAATIAQAVLGTHIVQDLVHDKALNGPQFVLATVSHVLLAINMYRCYVIWGCQRKVLIPPALLMLATLVTATIAILPSSSVSALVIPCGLAAGTNITLTTLTAGRILWISRQSTHVGLSHAYRSRYSRAIRIILESGAIYCVAVIFLLIAASRNNFEVFEIGYAIGQQAVNIIPTFTLVYVGLHDTADNPPTGSGGNLSSTEQLPTHFRSHAVNLYQQNSKIVWEVKQKNQLPNCHIT
ncbi:hypothetical protein B0H12DRAFT_1283803 [Mycena haematopus]|nr:hypothetical protein B0H12DRAFT_1283803 [Mycena haematopus]